MLHLAPYVASAVTVTRTTVVIRAPQRTADLMRALAKQDNCTLSDIALSSLRLRCSLGAPTTPSSGIASTLGAPALAVLVQPHYRTGTALLRLTLNSALVVQAKETAKSAGISIGLLLAEGVSLVVASRGESLSLRGVHSLPRGRRAQQQEGADDELFVVLDDDQAA